jgi:putative FmdB family regulatory protein
MPTYEYECDGCGYQFEEMQSMSDQPLTKCPQCKKKKLRRLFGTGAGLLFKGSGFYITDYRSESYKSAASKDAPAATPPAKDTSAPKSDSGGSKPSGGGEKK